MTRSDPPDAFRLYSVASRSEWIGAGISPKQLRTLVRAGLLVRVGFGVYATAEAVAESSASAAQAHALKVAGAVADRAYAASHESAALIHHLDLLTAPADGAVTLTREPDPRNGRGRRNPRLIVHSARLPDTDLMVVGGVRVTTPARTVIDLARARPFIDAVVVADSAIRRRKASKAQMRSVLQRCERWPGAVVADRVIDFSNGLSESVLESCARVRFHESGLPEPRPQAEFFANDGRSARADFFWPEFKTIGEADGMLKYDDPAAARGQFKRDRLLRDLGHKVVHFTWFELFNQPELVITRIRKAFVAPAPW